MAHCQRRFYDNAFFCLKGFCSPSAVLSSREQQSEDEVKLRYQLNVGPRFVRKPGLICIVLATKEHTTEQPADFESHFDSLCVCVQSRLVYCDTKT